MELAGILTNQVVVMFLLLATGMLLYKIGMITDEGNRQMAGVVLYVVAPLLILDTYSMEYDASITKNMLWGFGLSAISIIIGILISYGLKPGSKPDSFSTERFTVIFTNCGFMGIPLAQAVFGDIGVIYCTTYITMFNLFVWTYGLALMRGKSTEKRSVKEKLKPFLTPTMFCIVIGLLVYFLRIPMPKQLKSAIGYISSMNTPLAMIVSGIYIAQGDLFGALRKGRVYVVSAMKCLAVPFLMIFVLMFLPFDEKLKTTMLILSACPSGANGMLFANRFGGDTKTASNVFTVTTIASIVCIPFMVICSEWLTKLVTGLF
ncbi:MAG: AEC family transporter [Lachnospiraceae bacterium]|nr:AEC family transporter [Lachnospiraceae bacterium]